MPKSIGEASLADGDYRLGRAAVPAAVAVSIMPKRKNATHGGTVVLIMSPSLVPRIFAFLYPSMVMCMSAITCMTDVR